MTMTILTALSALMAGLITQALVVPTQETLARVVSHANRSVRAVATRSFGHNS